MTLRTAVSTFAFFTTLFLVSTAQGDPPVNSSPDTAIAFNQDDEDVGHDLDVSEATIDFQFPVPGCTGSQGVVYYRFFNTSVDPVFLELSTEGSNADTSIAVFGESEEGGFPLQLACTDEFGGQETLTLLTLPPDYVIEDPKDGGPKTTPPDPVFASYLIAIGISNFKTSPGSHIKLRGTAHKPLEELATQPPSLPLDDLCEVLAMSPCVAGKQAEVTFRFREEAGVQLPLPINAELIFFRINKDDPTQPPPILDQQGIRTNLSEIPTFFYTRSTPGTDSVNFNIKVLDTNGKLKEFRCAGIKEWIQPETNDEFEDAIDILTCPFKDMRDGQAATIGVYDNEEEEVPEPDPGCVSPPSVNGKPNISKSLWYKYSSSSQSPEIITLSTSGSDYDTVVEVFECEIIRDRLRLNLIACNDDVNPPAVKTSLVQFQAQPGQNYCIRVSGKFFDNPGGMLMFCADCTELSDLLCGVDPIFDSAPVNTDQSVTVTVIDDFADPVSGVDVRFDIVDGPTLFAFPPSFFFQTDINGQATLTYSGPFPGTDRILITSIPDIDPKGPSPPSGFVCEASREWVECTCEIDPPDAINMTDTLHGVTVKVLCNNDPQEGATANLEITSGPNMDETFLPQSTDMNGNAGWAWTGNGGE